MLSSLEELSVRRVCSYFDETVDRRRHRSETQLERCDTRELEPKFRDGHRSMLVCAVVSGGAWLMTEAVSVLWGSTTILVISVTVQRRGMFCRGGEIAV